MLVAAGEGFDGGVRRGGLDLQQLDVLIGKGFRLGSGEGAEEALHHLEGQDDVFPNAEFTHDTVALSVLRQVSDTLLHGVQGLAYLYFLTVHPDAAAGDVVGAKDGADTLTAPGAQQPGKAVDLALTDGKVEGLDACVAAQGFRLQHGLVHVDRRAAHLALDVGHVVQLLAQRLADQLDPWQVLNDVFTHQLAVPQNGDPVTDLIELLQKVGDEDDAHALGLQVPHQAKELLYLLLVQGGGGFVQNEDLTLHVYRPGDATICCTAMEQEPSCCLGLAGMPRDARIFPAPSIMDFQFAVAPLVRRMYIFSATVRLGHRVISW